MTTRNTLLWVLSRGEGRREPGDYETADTGGVANLEAIFNSDWSDKSGHLDDPGPLVISPWAEYMLVIQDAKQTLYIELEELATTGRCLMPWPLQPGEVCR